MIRPAAARPHRCHRAGAPADHGHRQRGRGLVLRRRAPGHARAPGAARARAGAEGADLGRRRRGVGGHLHRRERRRGGGRARRAARRAPRRPRACASRSTPGSPRSHAPRSMRARACSTTSAGCAIPRSPTLAARDRRGARRHAHARRAQAGGTSPTTSDVAPTSSVPARADARWRARTAWPTSSSSLDPGPGLRQDARSRRSRCCATLERLRALGRPLLLAVSRKYFIGAITGRPPAERLAGTLAAAAWAVDAGAAILRVHDVAARARLPGRRGRRCEGRAEVPALRCRATSELKWIRGRTRASLKSPTRVAGRCSQRGRDANRHHATRRTIMAVLHRAALEASPLADLHAIASELGIDGFRRLRKAELIDRDPRDAGGDRRGADSRRAEDAGDARAPRAAAPTSRTTSRRRGGRAPRRGGDRRRPTRRRESAAERAASPRPIATPRTRRATSRDGRAATTARARTRRGRRRAARQRLGLRARRRRPSPPTTTSTSPPPRCAAASWSRATGSRPVRTPRRSERYPSLVRVDTINGAPAEEVAEGTPYDELPCAYPTRAPGARLRGPDAEGDRVADADRPRLACGDHRRSAGGQDGDAAPPRRGAGRRRGARGQPRAHRRAPGGGRRVEGRIAGPRGRADAGRRVPTPRARPWSARSRPPSASPSAAATPSCSSTRSTAIAPAAARRALGRRAQHRRRRLADGDRHRHQRARRGDHGDRASTPARPRRATSRRSTSSASGTLRPELLVGDAGAEAPSPRARAEA